MSYIKTLLQHHPCITLVMNSSKIKVLFCFCGSRQYDMTHKQWERPPEPMSPRIRPRSRSQPPAPYGGRQGYAPSMPSPNYHNSGHYGGASSPQQHQQQYHQQSSPTPKWGPNMANWATPAPPSPVMHRSSLGGGQQQKSRPASGTWGPDMHNWNAPQPQQNQQIYRPAQRPSPQPGSWGPDMNQWKPRYAPQQVTQTYRPQQQQQQQNRSSYQNSNFAPQQQQRSPAPVQQQQQQRGRPQEQPYWPTGSTVQSGYSSSPAGYATLPNSRSRQGQFHQQSTRHQQQTSSYQQQPQPQQNGYGYSQTLPRGHSAAAWNVGGGVSVSDL